MTWWFHGLAVALVCTGAAGALLRLLRPVRQTRRRETRPPVLVLIQARMESQRFPGKVLEPLGDAPMLVQQYRRVDALDWPHRTLILAPDTPLTWRHLAPTCRQHGCELLVVQGNPDDVLGRYVQAIERWTGYEWLVRLTGDCPLADPVILGEVLDGTLDARCQYGALGPGWADGLDVEVIHRDTLLAAHAEATSPSDREHVTPYIWRQPARFPAFTLLSVPDRSAECWSVDTEADLWMVRVIWERLGRRGGTAFSWRRVAALLDEAPDSLKAWAQSRARNAAYTQQVATETGVTETDWFRQRYGAKEQRNE